MFGGKSACREPRNYLHDEKKNEILKEKLWHNVVEGVCVVCGVERTSKKCF